MTVSTVTLNPSIDKTFAVDRVVPDRKLAGYDVRDYPGGGGINVARVVTRLGGRARALFTAGGPTGVRLGELLVAEQVPYTPVPIERAVRENYIVSESSTGAQYRFGLPGPPLSDGERARWMEAVRGVSADWIVFSGSLPDDVPVAFFEALLDTVPSGVRVAVDTKKEALRVALRRGVHLVKPNVHELSEVAGRELFDDAEVEHAARALIGRGGAQLVLVSLGRGGAMLVRADGCSRFVSPSVPAKSKVGAGDSMVGGVITALDQGRPIDDAVRLGVAAGAAAVMSEGTELCRREDVERLYHVLADREARAA